MNDFKSALWWTGAHMEDIDDVISVTSTRDSLSLEFPNVMSAETGRDSIHDAVMDMGWYMNSNQDNAGFVTVWRKSPVALTSPIAIEYDKIIDDSRIIIVRGFATLIVEESDYISSLELLPREHMYRFESMSFWNEWLRKLAKVLDLDYGMLQFAFALEHSLADLPHEEMI